jgi:hypothetical protein
MYEAINIKIAAAKVPVFNPFWGFPPSFTLTKKVPIIETIIPAAARNKGRITQKALRMELIEIPVYTKMQLQEPLN